MPAKAPAEACIGHPDEEEPQLLNGDLIGPRASADSSDTEEFEQILPEWLQSEDVVIAGMSGRFPESENVAEFAKNLFDHHDLITEDDRRWTPGFHGLPKRHGKLKTLNKFDAGFFGVHPKQAEAMDPQLRILLEVSYEAILDSGANPDALRGSKTGVFIGASGSETGDVLTRDPEAVVGYSLTGCIRAMFANRLSFTFDFRGPSFAVDTACSSGLLALQLAYDSIKNGQCESALVAGSNLTLTPTTAMQFHKLGMLSPQGKCQSFDEGGDGYVRSEAIVAVFLQKAANAKRIYAQLVHAKSSTDGFKEQGITYPIGERQAELLREVYQEANVDPSQINYVETHGTGTKVGDPQECNAIASVFCEQRSAKNPLLIGSVKSNMGHAEPASGLASVVKVLIAMECGQIPANLHFKSPNPNIQALVDGRMKVVAENFDWAGGYAAVNSFGFGGANTHCLLRSMPKEPKGPETSGKSQNPISLICYSGRTEDALKSTFDDLKKNSLDLGAELILANQCGTKTNLHPYRGYMVVGTQETPLIEIQRTTTTEHRPIWYIYSGMGSQWTGMGCALLDKFPIFKQTIQKCASVVRPFGLDLFRMISNKEPFETPLANFVGICAVQLALTDLLKVTGLRPDGIIGHSTGEMVAAYADGCMTLEQTMLCAYYRGKCVTEAKFPPCAMAAVGLSWEEAKRRCPEGVVAACHNAADSVTISGSKDAVLAFVDQLKSEGSFAKLVNSSGIAFHSPWMQLIAPLMKAHLQRVLAKPKLRSTKWISTSVPESKWGSDLGRFCSADYQVNNLTSPVLFQEALDRVPENAVVIEIAPHTILHAILRRSLPKSCQLIGLQKSESENVEFLLKNFGNAYLAGLNLNASKLFDSNQKFPVPQGTSTISSMIRWDHGQDWFVPSMKDFVGGAGGSGASIVTVDCSAEKSEDRYLLDHVIDGRPLFPFTGYLVMAWKKLCGMKNVPFGQNPVRFENVVVNRATIISKPVEFSITVSPISGKFEIFESDAVAASGQIWLLDAENSEIPKSSPNFDENQKNFGLNSNEIYRELLLRGYEYGKEFRCLLNATENGRHSTIKWTPGNWVPFLDNMLQASLLSERSDSLKLPVRLRFLSIDPKVHENAVNNGENHSFIHAQIDPQTGTTIAGGVVLKDLTVQSAPRRQNAQIPTLESFEFVPYFDAQCLRNFPKIRQNLQKYAIACKSVALGHSPEAQSSEIGQKNQTLLEILSEKEKNLEKLTQDPLFGAVWIQDRSLAPLLDVVLENVGTRLNCGSQGSNFVADRCKNLLGRNPMLNLNWDSDPKSDPRPAKSQLDLFVLDSPISLKGEKFSEILESVGKNLKPNGFLLVSEITGFPEIAEILIGREFGQEFAHNRIVEKFSSGTGFEVAGFQTDPSFMTTLYLLRKIPEMPENPKTFENFLEISAVDEFSWISEIKSRISDPENFPKPIWISTLNSNSASESGIAGFANCLKAEFGVESVKIFQNASLKPNLVPNKSALQRRMHLGLFANVYQDGQWGSFRHIPMGEESKNSKIETEFAYVNTLTRGDLSSLSWIASPLADQISENPKDHCEIFFAALNFRDVMLATGRLSADAIPGKNINRDCLLGMEFSGRMKTNGNRVMGLLPAQGLATSVLVDERFCWPVPGDWTLEQAATVPVVYTTAYYALFVRGRLQAGESVLIHSGSGGVGQAAIRLALAKNCKVFTTIGSEEKRIFLQKEFPQLNENSFASSRSCDFEDHIKRETRGRGVDLVLNSLSEDKLQASVRCLAEHGRFLEIGKFDLSNNSALGMAVFLKNVTFHGILLDSLFGDPKNREWAEVARLLDEGLKSGIVKPLESTVFEKDEIEPAFRFMAQGKHIGKVLIKVRNEHPATVSVPVKIPAIQRVFCNPNECFVITGGLGGFGLQLVEFFISRGAKKFVLLSRNGITTGYQSRLVNAWISQGVRISIEKSTNLTKFDEVRELLKNSEKNFGKIGGIFHLAMELADAEFQNQTAEKFAKSAAAKQFGTKNLDLAAREICPNLRFFVGFSSISCGRGNAGQTNYGWTNSAMERILENRRAAGFPALAIQWGAIGDVGVVIDSMGGDNSTVVGGTLPQRIPSCMQTLEKFLLESDGPTVLSSFVKAELKTAKSASNSGEKDAVALVANILGVKDPSKLNADAAFGDLGLDSLMSVEIKQTLEREFNLNFSPNEIRNMTLNKLKGLASGESGPKRAAEPEQIVLESKFPFNLTFDFNKLKPTDPMVKLNQVEHSAQIPAIFCVHSIEGIAENMKLLASKMPLPFYCFQCVPEAPLDSIENLAKFYLKFVLEKQPAGPLIIMGYSYGTSAAIEMALSLKHLGRECKLILLDGSPKFVQTLCSPYIPTQAAAQAGANENLLESDEFQVKCFTAFGVRFSPKIEKKTIRDQIKAIGNFEDRLNFVLKAIVSNNPHISEEHLQHGLRAMCCKIAAGFKYKPKETFAGETLLIKARSETMMTKAMEIGDDYGLAQICSKIKVIEVNGDHEAFVQEDTFAHVTAEHINKFF